MSGLSNNPRSAENLGSEDGRASAPVRPWWLGVGIIAMGAIWLYGAVSLPQTAQYAAIGPGLFVTLIGLALVILGGFLLWQIAHGEEFAAQDSEDAMAGAPADWTAFLTAVVAAGLPLLTMRTLGFPVTAAISFALVARAFGSRRLLLDIVIGAVLSVVAYFGFSRLGVSLGDVVPILSR